MRYIRSGFSAFSFLAKSDTAVKPSAPGMYPAKYQHLSVSKNYRSTTCQESTGIEQPVEFHALQDFRQIFRTGFGSPQSTVAYGDRSEGIPCDTFCYVPEWFEKFTVLTTFSNLGLRIYLLLGVTGTSHQRHNPDIEGERQQLCLPHSRMQRATEC